MRFHLRALHGFLLSGALLVPGVALGGLSFDGTNQYVTFGTATNLGSPVFTLETWFNWNGGGVPANTGNGGIAAIPLITKLSAEQDGDSRDGNYFIGIRVPQGVLAADLEEGAAGAVPGLNHPVSGVTAVTPYTWHHAAVTYNGTNWLLFLDGNLEGSLTVGQPPRFDSIQHAALASSLNSTGAPQGYFAGLLDEVRIWSYARSASQIASNQYVQIRSAPGLLGRWSLDETNGLIVHDTSGHGAQGTLVNGPRWVSDDRAAADVVTPIRLSAIDPDRTAAVRQAEAKRVPPIFRYDPGVVEQVEKSLRASFRGTNKALLIGTNLSRLGDDGLSIELVQGVLAARVRLMMAHYICPDTLSGEAKAGPPNVRFYTSAFSNATPDLASVQAQGLSSARTNLWPLAKARAELRQRFPTNEQPLAAYLAGFVKENCLFDAELTRQARARHAESFFAADRYEPGQVIVRKGKIIDARIRAALDELKTQMAANERNARAAAQQAQAENAVKELEKQTAQSEFKSQLFSQQNRWLLFGLIAVAVTSSIAVWQLSRSRRGQVLPPVPVRRSGDAIGLDTPAEGREAAEWRERALHAEKRAAETSAVIRAGLLPHLAHWLKQKLVKRLVAERSHLLSTQEKAELDLAELEARLARLHAPMEQRLQLYRQRIEDLERELAAKGEENRELIQAKIELTRKKLESEHSKVP